MCMFVCLLFFFRIVASSCDIARYRTMHAQDDARLRKIQRYGKEFERIRPNRAVRTMHVFEKLYQSSEVALTEKLVSVRSFSICACS